MTDNVQDNNTMNNILVRFGSKENDIISIAQLRLMEPEARKTLLGENESKWGAIDKLYKINEKEHLFDGFSDPPTLDFITKISEQDKKRGKGGNYNPQNNTLIVENKETTDLTLATIAHELKHAQQMQGDMFKIFTGEIKTNPREKLQLKFLTEAQAFAFDSYVYYKASDGNTNFMGNGNYYQKNEKSFEPIEKILKDNPETSWQNIEGKLINAWLNVLYEGKALGYRNKYLDGHSLDPQNTTLKKIPESFHLSESVSQEELLTKLAQAPLTPTTKEKKTLRTFLLKATQEGKNDPRNQMPTNTEKKTIFPQWLKNPSWLWRKNNQK